MVKMFARRTQSAPGGEHSHGRVLKSATGYKAEQGSHYAPGISAETVGSSVLWFGW